MDTIKACSDTLRERLLALRDPVTGVWTGELASSALATALAVAALDSADPADQALSAAGAAWLCAHANGDGGWGDTPESFSNLSATLIATAALRLSRRRSEELGVRSRGRPGGNSKYCVRETVLRAEAWTTEKTGTLEPAAIAQALRQVYGEDRTFAVPILAFLAMCGTERQAWLSVPPLPFLLALLPQSVYRFFKLQVVSYALPALIAVGLCRHVCVAQARGCWPWGRLFAGLLARRLSALQPRHGGFLDAIPLTAFVCLAWRTSGYGEQPVAQKGLDFLRRSVRADGSWAIDSNLRTWVTSLATRSVVGDGKGAREDFGVGAVEAIATWLVNAQVKRKHPFTGAQPGGWAWTEQPGGVPDADDTAGALIALTCLKGVGCKIDVSAAVQNGFRWLLAVQNADGGMPTFCRGWGRLPFDRSCPDISAHALAALSEGKGASSRAVENAIKRLIRYLAHAQAEDGSWTPLWFGHQEAVGGRNPVVGTARVVDALRKWEAGHRRQGAGVSMVRRGEMWLLNAQKAEGGWGMGRAASVEETALSVIALTGGNAACAEAARRGCGWLVAQGVDGLQRAAPIGLYFSLLWYHERLYPLVWSLEALGRNVKRKEE